MFAGFIVTIIICLSIYPDHYNNVFGPYVFLNRGVEYAKKEDYKNAVKLWEIAAQKGSHEAEYNLGLYYMRMPTSLKDFNLGVSFMRKAAAGGIDDAKDVLEKLPTD